MIIRSFGRIYKDGEGRIRPNPYIAIANQQMREIKSFAAEFGLTPSNRSAMIANVMTAMKQNVDPMEAILVSDTDEDVQIVGYDGAQCFGNQEYYCSTIIQPVEEMARLCVDLVLQSAPQSVPCLLQLPVTYASGGSTRD